MDRSGCWLSYGVDVVVAVLHGFRVCDDHGAVNIRLDLIAGNIACSYLKALYDRVMQLK